MASKARPRRAQPAQLDEEPPAELDFEKGDDRSGRAGDLRDPRDDQEEFPAARVREAGRTGGENPGGEVTADDLSPETLLDEDRSRTPAAQARRASADSVLRNAGEDEIGEGQGQDEAELARSEAQESERSSAGKRRSGAGESGG